MTKSKKSKLLWIIITVAVGVIIVGLIFVLGRRGSKSVGNQTATFVKSVEGIKIVGLSANGKDMITYEEDEYLTSKDIQTNKESTTYQLSNGELSNANDIYKNRTLLYSPDKKKFVITDYNVANKLVFSLLSAYTSSVYTNDGKLVNEIGTSMEKEGSRYQCYEYSPTFSCDGKSLIYEQINNDGDRKASTMIKDLSSNEERCIFEYDKKCYPYAAVQLKEGLYLSLISSSPDYTYDLYVQSENANKREYEISLPEGAVNIKKYSEDRHTFLIELILSNPETRKALNHYYLLKFNDDFTEYQIEKLAFGDSEYNMIDLDLSFDGSYMIGVKEIEGADPTRELFLYRIQSKEVITIDTFTNDNKSLKFVGAGHDTMSFGSGILLSAGPYFAVRTGMSAYNIYQLGD